MPLLLLAIALVLTPVVLVPVSLVLRYRAGTARRQARGWIAILNLIGLAISTMLFLMGAASRTSGCRTRCAYSLLGLLGGFALGIVGFGSAAGSAARSPSTTRRTAGSSWP